MKIRKIIVASLTSIVLLSTCVIPTNASAYKSYSYWYKKDSKRTKPRTVVLTKKITIRRIAWSKNSISHHLGKSETLKKGTEVSILAYNPKYCWAFFNSHKNWVYPHKTANWFKRPKQYSEDEIKNKFSMFLDRKTYHIKNKGNLKLTRAIAKNNQVTIWCNFKNKSKSTINVADLINHYLNIYIYGTNVNLQFSNLDILVPKNKSEDVRVISNVKFPEALSSSGLTIASRVPMYKDVVLNMPLEKEDL